MNSKKWLSTNYFLQYLVQGVFFQYWLVYLTSVKGISILYSSMIFSMVYFARFISGVFLSPLIIKKFGMINSYRIIAVSGFISVIFYEFVDSNFELFLITFLFGITYFSLTPLTETTSSIFLKEGDVDYGKVRVFGSIGYMLSGIILGGFLGYVSKNYIFYTMLLLVFLYMIFTFLKMPKILENINIEQDNKKLSYSWLLLDKNAILLIFLFFFLQISHSAYNNYSYLYIENLNISYKWLLGLIVNISVISEIIFFIFSRRFIGSIKPEKLLIFSCLTASFRWFIIGIFPNVYIFLFSQMLHAVTFALAQVSFILILNSNFSNKKILDMQNLYSAIGFQLSAFLGMYVVGALWDISIQFVFIISSLLAFISFFIALRLKFNK